MGMTREKIMAHYGPLDDQAVAVELGGYAGNFSLDVLNTFSPKAVYVFEPVPAHMAMCRSALAKWNNVTYHEVAVGETAGDVSISVQTDATNLYSGTGTVPVKVVTPETLLELLPPVIDLININCEGGEYCFLDYLIETGHIRRFKHMWIQFHSNVPNFGDRLQSIASRLEVTHRQNYSDANRWQEWCLQQESNLQLTG